MPHFTDGWTQGYTFGNRSPYHVTHTIRFAHNGITVNIRPQMHHHKYKALNDKLSVCCHIHEK